MIRGRNASPLANRCEFRPITSALVKLVLRSLGSDRAARPTLANGDSVFGHGRRTVEDFWRASFGPVGAIRGIVGLLGAVVGAVEREWGRAGWEGLCCNLCSGLAM